MVAPPPPGPPPPPALHTERLGAGPRIVLVHGFTQTARVWASVAAALARDHEVLLVDAPGHGASGHIEADLALGARLLGDAAGRSTYIGYSMGGRLALHLALDRPALVDRLVLVGATAGIEDPAERSARRRADENLADHLEAVGVETFLDEWLAQPLFAGLSSDAAARQERSQNTATGLAASLRLAGTGTQQPLWDRLASLDMPVLLVAGSNDAKFLALAERMAACIGSHADVVAIEGAGHSAPFEQPERFAAVVSDWLRRR